MPIVYLPKWQRGVQRTADRAGLLLCPDQSMPFRILAEQDSGAERDLVLFALSETYSTLRHHLGIVAGR